MPGLGDDDHDDSHIGRVLDGRYRITAPIASGGMGMVYRGERIGIGKQVAIKLLHRSAALNPEHRRRFEREAVAMSRVSHPNLVSIIDHGIVEGNPYLVMEYHPGQTLREALAEGPISGARAVAIARHIVSGMRAFHEAGIIHRDLKPENVMLVFGVEQGHVKVLDFGVAKLLDPDGENDVTRAGHVVGTPAYLSPEQARLKPLDARSDIYTFGVLLFEMVTGRRPFEAEDALVFLRLHAEQPPPRPRALGARISVELEDVIMVCLAKDPVVRYQSATDLARALSWLPEAGPRKPTIDPNARTSLLPTDELDESAPVPKRSGIGRRLVYLLVGAAGVFGGLVLHDPTILDRIRGTPRPTPPLIVPPDAAVPVDAASIAIPIDAPAPVIDAAIDAAVDASVPSDATELPGDAGEPDASEIPPP
ncbi:MAG TPA: serine/threonine-protein kinase [Kofleriaceae bacterium]